MNAAIRSVVRTGIHKGWEVFGIRRGYAGLISGHLQPMGARDVSNILQQGGTVLGSARSASDRLLATHLGAAATDYLQEASMASW